MRSYNGRDFSTHPFIIFTHVEVHGGFNIILDSEDAKSRNKQVMFIYKHFISFIKYCDRVELIFYTHNLLYGKILF